MQTERHQRAHIVLVILAVVLFNFPLMLIADKLDFCCGIGLLPVYVFVIWFGLIVSAAIISLRGHQR